MTMIDFPDAPTTGQVFVTPKSSFWWWDNRWRRTPKPALTVTSLNPAIASIGGPVLEVRVLGTGFEQSTVIVWDTTTIATTFVSVTELRTSIVPNGSERTVQVAARTGTETSNSLPFVYDIPTVDPLTLTALVPNHVQIPNSAAVSVQGTGFIAGSSEIYWGNAFIPASFISSTQMSVNISAATEVPRTIQVSVRNGGDQWSNALPFIYDAAPEVPLQPTITMFDPNQLAQGGDYPHTVTFYGSNFQYMSQVKWNGVLQPQANVTFLSATALRVVNLYTTPPGGPESLPVQVINDTLQSNIIYFYCPAP